MTMKILDYRRPPASYWRVPHDNFHYFIIFHYFGHILTHAKVYLLFVDAARAIIDFVQSTFCYNEGSGHVLMWGMISSSKNNYESAILCKCIWELWRHARRSYFRRFHWISESFLFHSGGVSSPLDGTMWHGPQCCCRAVDLYCPWMDFINDRRTSPDGCKPIIPPPMYVLCTIGINCFALFYWIHA